MQRRIRCAAVLCLVAVLAATPALARKKKKDRDAQADDAKPSVTVERWLVLGPALEPLPVFHDAATGGVALKDLLDARTLPRGVEPRPGGSVTWFGDRTLTWTARDAKKQGLLELTVPERAGETTPAVVWVASFVRSDRFREVEIELLGQHPRRAWLDGRDLVSGVEGELRKKTELTTGRHLLLVETMFDAGRDDPWQIGARLSAVEDDDALAGAVATLDPAHGVDIADVIDAPSIGSLSVAPDGSAVALSLRRFFPGTKDRESWIEVRDATDATLLRSWRGAQGMDSVAWAPTGRRLTYTSSDDDETTLWLADLDDGSVRPLLERVEDFAGYVWSPDGSTIAYSITVEPPDDKTGVKRVRGIKDRWAGYRTKRYLHLLDVESGARRRLTAGPLSTGIGGFSPDGRRLLFTRSVEDFERRPFSRTELWELDLRTTEAELLLDAWWLGGAEYAPDGKRLLLRGGAALFDEGVNVAEGQIPNSYDNQLFIWDPESKQAEAITRGFDPAVTGATWAGDGRIYLTAEDRDYRRLYRFDPRSKRFEPLPTGFDVFGSLDVARDGSRAVGTGSSPWRAPGAALIDLAGEAAPVRIEPAADWYADLRAGRVEPWSFDSESSGRTIDGRYYLPPDFDAEKRYPLIVYYYGGTSPTGRSFGGRYPKEYWASQGYVVYVLQPSGATGYGQEFSALHVNNWGLTTADEIIEGTQKFLSAHAFVDPERVGCIGASYGGFMTMLLSTKTDIFAGCVSHAGISALSSYWGEGYWGAIYSSIATADAYPWSRRDLYVDQSPLFRADRHRVPILLTHGDSDTNVPVGESDQFFVALKILGKDVEYLQVAGQDHWILEHDKRLLWSRSIVAWFDRWLKRDAAWWNHLHGDE